jgi:hypothetical protein
MLPPSFRSQGLETLPSPEQLRGKVLLKGNMLSVSGEQEDDESDTEDDEPAGIKTSKSNDVDYANLQLVHNLGFLVEDKNKKREKSEKELSDITHLRSVHFHGYDKAKSKRLII